MPKEKEAIGITLLDVLTNTFAAALLLMTIVAATVGSGDGNRTESEPGDGTDYVIAAQFGEDKKLERPDPPVITILLTFKGRGAERVRLAAEGTDENQFVSVRQGLYRPEQWSVFRRGNLERGWNVQFAAGSSLPDSVYVLISIGNKGLAPLTLPVGNAAELLEIDEPATTDESIKIFSQPVPTLY
jgi:hypothetical protein